MPGIIFSGPKKTLRQGAEGSNPSRPPCPQAPPGAGSSRALALAGQVQKERVGTWKTPRQKTEKCWFNCESNRIRIRISGYGICYDFVYIPSNKHTKNMWKTMLASQRENDLEMLDDCPCVLCIFTVYIPLHQLWRRIYVSSLTSLYNHYVIPLLFTTSLLC
jgi:hypothetical protein